MIDVYLPHHYLIYSAESTAQRLQAVALLSAHIELLTGTVHPPLYHLYRRGRVLRSMLFKDHIDRHWIDFSDFSLADLFAGNYRSYGAFTPHPAEHREHRKALESRQLYDALTTDILHKTTRSIRHPPQELFTQVAVAT